jgi:hypothetical protein
MSDTKLITLLEVLLGYDLKDIPPVDPNRYWIFNLSGEHRFIYFRKDIANDYFLYDESKDTWRVNQAGNTSATWTLDGDTLRLI